MIILERNEWVLLNLPDFSNVKKRKIVVHGLLIVVVLTLISLVVSDAISIVSHTRIRPNLTLVTVIMVLWGLWAWQYKGYQK